MFEFDFDGVKNCSVIAALPTNKDKSILSKPKHTKKEQQPPSQCSLSTKK